jgi:hypothetical protein
VYAPTATAGKDGDALGDVPDESEASLFKETKSVKGAIVRV